MKAVGKLLLCLLVITSTLLTFQSPKSEAATGFSDVGTSHRAYKEISYLAQGKIVTGSNGKYNGDRTVTRAEAAAMIGRALNLDGEKKDTRFADVKANNFASGYIDSAVAQGIISGYSDGTFKPDKNVNRGEMAVMISRAFEFGFNKTTAGATWALMNKGIANGMSNGSFGEAQSIIRTDFAIFLARSIDHTLRTKPDSFTFSGKSTVSSSGTLNVRKGPGTAYGLEGSLASGTEVTIGYPVGSWSYVKAANGSTKGFVSNAYLKVVTSADPDPLPPEPVKPSDPLSTRSIVIDPGHGGHDPGAVGFGLKEKDVVLDVGQRVQKMLDKTPIKVHMTRSTDVFIELRDRAAYSGKVGADSFVSIHTNAFNGSANGTETYYSAAAANPHTADSKLLAQKIHARLVKAMGTKDRGLKTANYYVTKYNTVPATLVELAFIDQKSDNSKLASPTYRNKAAQAIYWGVLDYYKAKGYDTSRYY